VQAVTVCSGRWMQSAIRGRMKIWSLKVLGAVSFQNQSLSVPEMMGV
jgi:hypothetical protein